MINDNTLPLDESVRRQFNSRSGSLGLPLLFTCLASTSVVASLYAGFQLAAGQNVSPGYIGLSVILPAAAAYAGHQFPHLSGKGDPLSGNYKIPSPLRNCAKYFSIGLAIQAVAFGAGYSLGQLAR